MVGQNIGKYRVLDRIGRGGMGTVYRAIDETLHREVAIKVLNAELNDPEVARRFRAEAITVARLSHPGIATIYELFEHEGQWLMVMEFVRGETLEKLAERLGTLSAQRTAELCMQVLAALAHAHSMGVVHRDLKPANLMITETGTVKIMDFGIARVHGTEHLTSAGFMMGTPAYMAPEQVMGHEIDARADLYAMGVVFYRLTSGKLPFRGDTPFAMAQSQVHDPPTPIGMFRGDLPAWVEQVIVRSLAKTPGERFQSAIEFHEAFARCLAGLPMTALYSSSAPTELLATPPRALPTSSIHRPMTSPLPPLTGVPTLGTAPVGADSPPATPSSGRVAQDPSQSVANYTPTVSGLPPATPATPVNTAPSVSPERKQFAGMIAAAVAVVVVIGAGYFWVRSRQVSSPPPAAEATPPVSAPAPPTAPVESAAPAVTNPAPPASAPPSSPPATSKAPVDRGNTSAAAGPAASSATNALPGEAPPVEDTALVFPNAKMLVVSGRKTDDQDVGVHFGGGQVSIVAKTSGIIVAAMPYKAVVGATYVRARDPKWDSTLSAPPQNLDVGGILRTPKHWLVLQSKDAYLILRLDDSNWRRIYDTVEARTRLSITRPAASDKP